MHTTHGRIQSSRGAINGTAQRPAGAAHDTAERPLERCLPQTSKIQGGYPWQGARSPKDLPMTRLWDPMAQPKQRHSGDSSSEHFRK